MILVAIDTCDASGSVAVLRDNEVLQAFPHDVEQDYSSWLLPAVERLLEAASLTLREVEIYAAAAGPGSFTGVRVGLTTVKAWSEVYGRPIAVVSRLEALASQASGSEPLVAAFADARRGQVFGALYRRAERLERIGEELVIAPEKFVAWVAENSRPSGVQWISTEAKCLEDTEAWRARQSAGESIQIASALVAPWIGRLGYQLALEGRLSDALTLDANYVRRSDAEIFWKSAAKGEAK